MKKFLCFTNHHYYPDGGWRDFRGSYESVAAAIAANPIHGISYDDPDWRQIVDADTLEVVEDTAQQEEDEAAAKGSLAAQIGQKLRA